MDKILSRKIFLLWSDINSIIGPAYYWPAKIRELFWTKDISYVGRFKIAIFGYVNGLNPEVLEEWLRLKKNIDPDDEKAWRHIKTLFTMLEDGLIKRDIYWAFNVANNRFEFLSGKTRYYKSNKEEEK